LKNKKKEEDFIHVNLRVRNDILELINQAVDEDVGISRNGWIVRAIHEKLNKDNL
jgi:hypothetical protein